MEKEKESAARKEEKAAARKEARKKSKADKKAEKECEERAAQTAKNTNVKPKIRVNRQRRGRTGNLPSGARIR